MERVQDPCTTAAAAEPRRARVLVCDDSPTMRAIMRSLLGEAYTLRLTSSGEETLDVAEDFEPDVIVCDLLLPGLSGSEVCRRLRAIPALCDVPFVLVTALADSDARACGLEAGADDYLYKPVRERELLARVASLVRLRREGVRAEERLRALEAAHVALEEAQGALVRAEKLASVGALAAGLAHEINNPLSYIKSGAAELVGYLDDVSAAAFEALGRAPGDDALRDRLMRALAEANAIAAEMADGSRRLERVTQDLRVFAGPALGADEAVDPAAALESAWMMVRARYAALPAWAMDAEPGEPLVAARALVVQPLTVVLESAVLAAGPRGRVHARVTQIAGGVEVRVHDSGPGIPRDALPRVFDPFFTTRLHGQAGPGLSVAYGIVHGLGGDMAVESPPGEGTTFRLRFPRRAGAFARLPNAGQSDARVRARAAGV